MSAISGTCSAVFFSNEIRQTLDCLDCLPFSRNVCRQMFQHLLLSSEKFELVTRCVNTFSRCVNTFTYSYKKVFPLNDEQGVGVCSTAKILTRIMLCNTVCESNVQVVLKLPVPARRPLITLNLSRYWHAKPVRFLVHSRSLLMALFLSRFRCYLVFFRQKCSLIKCEFSVFSVSCGRYLRCYSCAVKLHQMKNTFSVLVQLS